MRPLRRGIELQLCVGAYRTSAKVVSTADDRSVWSEGCRPPVGACMQWQACRMQQDFGSLLYDSIELCRAVIDYVVFFDKEALRAQLQCQHGMVLGPLLYP